VSNELAVVTCATLLATAVAALFSKKVTTSLIMLFYCSVVLGIVFTLYGSIFVGLFHIITFAGAVSVMLLTAVLMTGESNLSMGTSSARVLVLGGVLLIVGGASVLLLGGLPTGLPPAAPLSPTDLLQFIWELRPWDLLILLMVFASSMIVVANLLSRDER
jgi:NADH:ubiquinone oxidoreductase subunit 6 (subunit J)